MNTTNADSLLATSLRTYLSPPDLGARERELLLAAFDSNWITTLGPQVDRFEEEMAAKVGVPFAVALASGTAALHLALIGLEVRQEDIVFCSDLTFAASANPIAYLGAEPVFIDSCPATWNMDPGLLQQSLEDAVRKGRLPKAVIVVDLYGQAADYDEILRTCQLYEVPVIEDSAEALGASYGGKSCGSLGAMGILSFNGNKIITTSGGGMLLSNTKKYVDLARLLATQARDPMPYYQHSRIGFNYRLSNLLAAIGRGQLERLDAKVARRREINRLYRVRLEELPGIQFMPEASYGRPNCWLTCITIDPSLYGATNEELRLFLEQRNIESRHVWKPMHMQPVFAGSRCYGGQVSEDLFTRGLCLPSGSGMSDEDLDRVISLIIQFHEVYRK